MTSVADIVREMEAKGIRLPKLRVRAAVVVAVPLKPMAAVRSPQPNNMKNPDVTARRDQVAVLWREGKLAKEIADTLALSTKVVFSDVSQLQMQGKITRRKAMPHDIEARRADIADLHKAGLTAKAISNKLGMPVAAVRGDIYVLQDRGALPRRIGQRSADRTVM